MLNLYLLLIDTDEDKLRFITLYNQYSRLMFNIAQEILKDEHLSEDAVQESFLRIAKNFQKINEILCPQTRNFLVIITRNVAIRMCKNKISDLDMDTYASQEAFTLSDDLFETISNKLLAGCILELPEMYRDVLYLYHIYGYTFPEVSNLLSISVETAKKRAQRARHILGKLLEKEGYIHE